MCRLDYAHLKIITILEFQEWEILDNIGSFFLILINRGSIK